MAELVYAHALGACPERGGGSSPLPPILTVLRKRPIGIEIFTLKILNLTQFYAAVIQLARMPPCQGGCRGFESHPPLFWNFDLTYFCQRDLILVN